MTALIWPPAALEPMRLASPPEMRVRVSSAVTLLPLWVTVAPFSSPLPV
jgi:hypothetical protein